MKSLFVVLVLIFSINIYADDTKKVEKKDSKELILKLDSSKKYTPNDKYKEVPKIEESKKKKDSSLDVDVGTDFEKKEVDSIKVQKGIKF